MKNIVMIKIVEVMSNYEKKLLSSVAYRMNIEGLLELNAEATIFVQLNEPVADTDCRRGTSRTPPGGFRRPSMTFPAYVHNSNIKLDHYY